MSDRDPPIPFPDFFLAGAPRCGTTALTAQLKYHPQICFSKPKEPHYFTKIEPLLPDADLRRNYLEPYFWNYDPDQHQVLGEGSVSTLYSPDAMRRIRSFNPDAKFIVVVRNPLEMLPSYHALMLYYLEEDVVDLGEAWRLQAERARGERIPKRCIDPRMLQYAEMAGLGARVDELFEIAGRERCHVVVYDDLAADPTGTLRQVLDFLGVDNTVETKFDRRNQSRHYRWAWLHQLVFRPPMLKPQQLVRYVVGRTRKNGRSQLKRYRKKLINWNTIEKRPAEIPPALREEVHATLQEDIELLGKLLDRDLSSWK